MPVTNADYDMMKKALERDVTPSRIHELNGFSPHTISRVKTTKNYKEFCEKRVKRTKVANVQKKTKAEVQKESKEQIPEAKEGFVESQEIHDIARELKNIRSILQKLAEDLGVKF
ncbi:MAG: hypothetical protein IKE40_02795 [Firmicutes bacterium]|nr:hypothetical protein [Bacillota bacterium]